MERPPKYALITRLMQELRDRGSWCGETHVQKATYLLQELLCVPLGFRFTLYWHGPFSFDLRDEITAMRADGLVEIEPVDPRYGPKLKPTEQAFKVQELFPKTTEKQMPKITFVADRLGELNVLGLEKTATGFYVTNKLSRDEPPEARAAELNRIKPHISLDAALTAINEVDQMILDAQAIV
ncbi:conserved hypothetical protein [Desulfatibacillum aliphaticivorans]|uniref:Antitoxin SocA-like Panacea domain-containing protein n=1 Tax=Desulfatibacillum aliphaticivorans TaxID=218208 RepID=B8FCJ0_DESAL|nr:hypothetical protein [Desulfatibacillum aliphaticivorans]ACL06153.1 conserved hypothetical protein [Desulfatibacillum aliphaticivorans]